MLKAKLVRTKDLAPDVRHFEFEAPAESEFRFDPGQFVSVVHRVDGKEITRAYSIASPRSGSFFALCLNRVDDGLISPYLFGLQPGDEIEVNEPLGYFTLRHPGHRAIFVATGTGIAPFRSMLLEHLPKTQPHIALLFGVRYERGLLYNDELTRLAEQYPTFRFIPTITRPSQEWRGHTGRVQTHLDEALNLQSYEDQSTLDVYICGMKEMVDGVRAELKQRGFDRKQIIYEKYD
ncbi:MAG: FAD-binding oxidoreductase [Acidobacteriota bacterium]|nr:FAD-binding oxidoreductase [Acidobacteriota bacterium]